MVPIFIGRGAPLRLGTLLHAPLAAASSFHRHARWAETAAGAAEGQY